MRHHPFRTAVADGWYTLVQRCDLSDPHDACQARDHVARHPVLQHRIAGRQVVEAKSRGLAIAGPMRSGYTLAAARGRRHSEALSQAIRAGRIVAWTASRGRARGGVGSKRQPVRDSVPKSSAFLRHAKLGFPDLRGRLCRNYTTDSSARAAADPALEKSTSFQGLAVRVRLSVVARSLPRPVD